jgi:hypothetical protein
MWSSSFRMALLRGLGERVTPFALASRRIRGRMRFVQWVHRPIGTLMTKIENR